jgi:hypothetical protein
MERRPLDGQMFSVQLEKEDAKGVKIGSMISQPTGLFGALVCGGSE